ERGFSWDEKRVICESRPGQADLSYSFRFGTATDAWGRSENKEKTSVSFTRRAGVGDYWDDPDSAAGTYMHLFAFSYLRLPSHRFWWGRSTAKTNAHTMCPLPLDQLAWVHLETGTFGGEACEVVESIYSKTGGKQPAVLDQSEDGSCSRR